MNEQPKGIFQKQYIISFILAVLFAFFVVWTFYHQKSRDEALERALRERPVYASETFNAELGRAEIHRLETEDFEHLLDQRFAEMNERIGGVDEDIRKISVAVVKNRSSGGGKLVRTARAVPGDDGASSSNSGGFSSCDSKVPEEDSSFAFKDFRLDLRIAGEDLSYTLHQRFNVVVREDLGPVNGSGESPLGETSQNGMYIEVYELDDKGARVGDRLEVVSFDVYKREALEKRFSLLNPKIDLDLLWYATDLDSTALGAGLSIMSYGKTDDDLEWKFLTFEVAYDDTLAVGVCPASYNVGKVLPLITNLFIKGCYLYALDDSRHIGAIGIGGQL